MNQPIQQVQSTGEKDGAVDLNRHIDFLFDNWRLIARVALVVMFLGAVYAFMVKPIYEANILIQVEDSTGSTKNILSDLSSPFDIKTGVTTEMEILRSRLVVSRAIDNARLAIGVQPKYFPGIGAWIARHNKDLSDPGLFGYGGYVWGAERADVSVFNVPEQLEDDVFVLTAKGNDTFHVSQPDEGIEIDGRTGETVKVRSGYGEIALRVDRLGAKPGAQFLLTRTAQLNMVEDMQNALMISERGKQSNIINATLNGPDPVLISRVLNEIGREYIRQNTDRKSEEAEKSLVFLNKQLPDLKQELERAETKYKELRNTYGTVDLGEEGKSLLQQSALTSLKMVELKQKREELLTRFQQEHPVVTAINQQMRELNREMASVDAKMKKLPAVEQDVLRLTRDIKVNTELYTQLLGAAQQLRLTTASKVGSARLLDSAVVPLKPIKPKRFFVILVASAIGLVLGGIAAYIKKMFSGRVNDPQEIEQLLGLPVSAAIPHSTDQKQLPTQVYGGVKKVSVFPHDTISDSAIESLRGFRTSLQFAMRNAKNNVVMITGPTSGVGKSFVSANFSAVLAAFGNRVLLIDGDLRTGHLHRNFGVERKNGLSDAIHAKTASDPVIHKNVVDNVDFISTGCLPAKPAELLAHTNLGRLLEQVATHYDFVLIDTAPVLAASDALVIGAHAGTIINIVRGGLSTVSEIEETIKRLNQAGYTVTGTVFNDLKPRYARYGYGMSYGKYR